MWKWIRLLGYYGLHGTLCLQQRAESAPDLWVILGGSDLEAGICLTGLPPPAGKGKADWSKVKSLAYLWSECGQDDVCFGHLGGGASVKSPHPETPACVSTLCRREVYRILQEEGVDLPRYAVLNRDPDRPEGECGASGGKARVSLGLPLAGRCPLGCP